MKKILVLVTVVVLSVSLQAGVNNLLWDYTDGAPMHNPDRGLAFSTTVNDPDSVRNGLKGIKLNSSGWCSFTKAPVAGTLYLTFGPRSGVNKASLQVFAYYGEEIREVSLVNETCEVRALRTVAVPLNETQNNIYITRLLNTETVLQRIEFIEGLMVAPIPCEELNKDAEPLPSTQEQDSLSSDALLFLQALKDANQTGETAIYLPNGVYDLGHITLTAIEANNISIIGQSMDSVIIKNTPNYRLESIDGTATLRIAPGVEGTYMENLTIENALDYYKDDNGRAVALWDQGTKTVCKNVRLLSHQDTYYSDCKGAVKYFQDCEIHGTVDFICGDGSVYFKKCLLYCKKRSKDGSGTDALTASSADKEDKGFVFDSCTIQSECPVVSLGRSWKNYPKCVFQNTVLDYSAGHFILENEKIQRWTIEGMSVLPEFFGEYNTVDTEGKVVSPESNEVTFTYHGTEKKMETILLTPKY